jgi:hypothetical protein
MPDFGFGHGSFGHEPFGNINWCKVVLWDELDESYRTADEAAGSPYLKFVQSMAPSFNYLRAYIRRFGKLMDPRVIRHDLLLFFASNFGITIDLAEPEAFQRMRVDLAMRWNLIKGEIESYVVLCRVHGFEVNVIPLWWNGSEYVDGPPTIYRETSTHTATPVGPDTDHVLRLNCSPAAPGTIVLTFRKFSGATFTVTDDGLGGWNGGYAGTIDYGWGYLTLTTLATDTYLYSRYESVTGGCVETCGRCLTHRLRLQITPGTIGGQDKLTITDAFQRLYEKLGELSGDGVIPVHVELEQITISDTAYWSLAYRYDIIPADVLPADGGMHWVVP